MSREILIDPITRLEGHGRIHIFLDTDGGVDRAYLQIPELRGFEKFAQGRRAEDMPQITSRICGVCPMAHHMAATKALDDLYQVDPPPAARKIRELLYSAFMVEDHALHFFFLGGPDFIVGPDAPRQKRNILGVVDAVGLEIGKEVIGVRKQLRDLVAAVAGKAIHPVFGLPGGVSRTLSSEARQEAAAAAARAIEFSQFALGAFREAVLGNPGYVELITSEAYTHRTYYMGLVDEANKVTFYDGRLRIVGPEGKELLAFDGRDYLSHVAEHVEPWTYMKFCFLKDVGWNGFADGAGSGVYSVAPLARLNAADGMATPRAQEAYEEFVTTLGPKPIHYTLANHWARLIELVYAAERMAELAADPELTDPQVRTLPTAAPQRGRRRRGSPTGDPLPPLPDGRARAHHGREHDRRHAEQRREDRAVRRQGGARADQERPGRRRAAEPARDGVPRLRPVHGLLHAQPAWPHAADRRGQGRRRRAPAADPAGLTMRTLVLGLGNEYAGDDAVGVLAVRALRGKLAGSADVVESAASGLALLEVFAGYDRAVITDSIRTGRSPAGTIIEAGLADLGRPTAPSLHQAGIPELAAVARRLGMGFPDRTRVLAVEVAGPLMFGAPLSKPVAAAVAPLGRRILEQIQRWASENPGRGRPDGAGRGPEDTLPVTMDPSAPLWRPVS